MPSTKTKFIPIKRPIPPNPSSIIDKIKLVPEYNVFSLKNSIYWFRKQIKALGGVSPADLLADPKRAAPASTTELIGKLFFFAYDPKYKATLPYYDEFPLVFPIEIYDNGFLGINLHYLSMSNRLALFEKLLDFATNTKYNNNTKLIMSYRLLNEAAKYKAFKPCIHRYLWSHIQSQFVKIQAPDWKIALHLPVARFKKQSESYVWNESKKKL
jgi:hypothetical protein